MIGVKRVASARSASVRFCVLAVVAAIAAALVFVFVPLPPMCERPPAGGVACSTTPTSMVAVEGRGALVVGMVPATVAAVPLLWRTDKTLRRTKLPPRGQPQPRTVRRVEALPGDRLTRAGLAEPTDIRLAREADEELLERAGGPRSLRVTHLERHDQALHETIDRFGTRVRALRLVDLRALRGVDLRRSVDRARRVAQVVGEGDAGYMPMVATKPLPGT